jgi:hypothetical protein
LFPSALICRVNNISAIWRSLVRHAPRTAVLIERTCTKRSQIGLEESKAGTHLGMRVSSSLHMKEDERSMYKFAKRPENSPRLSPVPLEHPVAKVPSAR